MTRKGKWTRAINLVAKSTLEEFTYDGFGNVATIFDHGEPGTPADDVFARVTYANCTESHVLGGPTSIEARNGESGPLLRKREGDYECATGRMTQFRQFVESPDGSGIAASVTDLAYESPFGNLTKVTGPENVNGERFILEFEFDPEVRTHVVKITDSFGYVSTATHNLKFGKPEVQTSINGNRIKNVYDSVGRIVQVFGPYELNDDDPTLTMTYGPQGTPPLRVPFAVTENRERDADFELKTDTIDTIIFTDGLKRVIQSKKDAALHQAGGAPRDVMVISGRLAFNHVNRSSRMFYTTSEAKGNNTAFNPGIAGEAPPTEIDHDVLDRVLRVRLPDGNTSTMTHTIHTADGATRRR